MRIEEIKDINRFLYYLNLKNNSMESPMWKKEEITVEYFSKIYSTYKIYLVKEEEKVIGGFLLLDHDYTYWSNEENEKSCYYIHKLFILKEYNKKGYSPQIIQAIIKEGKKHNKKAIRLDSRSHLISLNHFYENLGFRVVRVMISPYSGKMNLRELNIE